jgi:hypothetical protein
MLLRFLPSEPREGYVERALGLVAMTDEERALSSSSTTRSGWIEATGSRIVGMVVGNARASRLSEGPGTILAWPCGR